MGQGAVGNGHDGGDKPDPLPRLLLTPIPPLLPKSRYYDPNLQRFINSDDGESAPVVGFILHQHVRSLREPIVDPEDGREHMVEAAGTARAKRRRAICK